MADNTENFDQLRKLLALKRHEQPPPGYFDKFSKHVIMRLHAGDKGEVETFSERLFNEAPWLQAILHAFQTKPVLAGGSGAAACALVLALIVVSGRSGSGDMTPGGGLAVSGGTGSDLTAQPLANSAVLVTSPDFSSTNGLSPDAAAALFSQMPDSSQRVRY